MHTDSGSPTHPVMGARHGSPALSMKVSMLEGTW